MKIVDLNGETLTEGTTAAIGFFDGVHLAHRRLLETTRRLADASSSPMGVITFDVHPKSVLEQRGYTYLTPLQRKLTLLAEAAPDTIYLIKFTQTKASLSPERFINHYLKGLKTLVCGFDFHFGAGAKGTVDTLRSIGRFETVVVDEMTLDGQKIGSTRIRSLIETGHVDAAIDMLGAPYRLQGHVVHGKNKGFLTGYPTANLMTSGYVLPKPGVYASRARIGNDRWRNSFTNIGCQPTLNDRGDLCVETHIFDYSGDLYGKTLEIEFIARLRDEKHFASLDELVAQLDADKATALEILKKSE